MMKKLFMVLIIIVAGVNVHSQDIFQLGVKGGYTSTRFNLDSYDQKWLSVSDYESQSGYLAGIYTRLKIFKGLSFQPEFYYASKKGEVSLTLINSDVEFPDTSFVTNIKSFELPMLLNLKLFNFEVLDIYAIGGPVLAFTNDGSTDPETKIGFNKTNWTIMVGGGLEFWRMYVDARYEWSLNNTASYTSSVGGYANFEEFYNMLTINVGFKLFGL